MAKPIKYRVVSFKDDIIILERMTGKRPTVDNAKPTTRELILALTSDVKSIRDRLSIVEDTLKRNNLR